ncbi:MAG: hypothetical protein IT385_19665 [Deltaproteobacteria bacterium]|nr:hypothetical protein [Deltaproteobacteria bacterium]
MRALALVLASLVIAACGTTVRWVPTNPSPRALEPRHPSTVEIWTTGVPNRPYTEVGIITARQSSEMSVDEMPEIISELREEAARIGCDAVMLQGKNDKVVGHGTTTFGTGGMHATTLEGYWGACLVYLDEPAPAPAPAP